MSKETGGPAFPRPWSGEMYPDGSTQGDYPREHPSSDGMTLRDWFAGRALEGILANPESEAISFDAVAAEAYQCADAMLEAREEAGDE